MSQGNEGHGGSVKAILYALGANFGIAVAKYFAAFWTGSGSMLAEAIHSTADCANQLLLLLGLKEAARPESADHPLGHHRVTYFWSMVVAQGMVRRLGPGSFLQAQQEQQLVGAVRRRVDSFRQHGTGAGPEGGEILGDGNAEIGP